MTERSDSELFELLVLGDEKAFEQFCARSLPTVLRALQKHCSSLGLSPDLAQDFAQDAFLSAIGWFRSNKTAPPFANKSIVAWLLTIARNKMYSHLRRTKKQRPLPDEPDTTLQNSSLEQPEGVGLAERHEWAKLLENLTRNKDPWAAMLTQLSSDDAHAIIKGFEQLSKQDREILELVLLYERSFEEIHNALKITLSAAYKRYERALKQLQSRLPKAPVQADKGR